MCSGRSGLSGLHEPHLAAGHRGLKVPILERCPLPPAGDAGFGSRILYFQLVRGGVHAAQEGSVATQFLGRTLNCARSFLQWVSTLLTVLNSYLTLKVSASSLNLILMCRWSLN